MQVIADGVNLAAFMVGISTDAATLYPCNINRNQGPFQYKDVLSPI